MELKFHVCSSSVSNPDRTAAHKDVCFQRVDEGLICSMPTDRIVVTYSECCCHYGRGWGPECNTCPNRNSGEPPVHLSGLSIFTADFVHFFCLTKKKCTPCTQRCSVACVRCILRLSRMESRISLQLLPTTTQVKSCTILSVVCM